MYHYCQYSFQDLFVASYGRQFTKEEGEEFNKLSQSERNQRVEQLAKSAGWKTGLVKTSVGEFVAFWP